MEKNKNYEKFINEYDNRYMAIVTKIENNYILETYRKGTSINHNIQPCMSVLVNKENYSIIEFLKHQASRSGIHNEKGEYRKKLRLLCAYINHKKNDNTIHKLISDREQLIKEDSDILNYWICK